MPERSRVARLRPAAANLEWRGKTPAGWGCGCCRVARAARARSALEPLQRHHRRLQRVAPHRDGRQEVPIPQHYPHALSSRSDDCRPKRSLYPLSSIPLHHPIHYPSRSYSMFSSFTMSRCCNRLHVIFICYYLFLRRTILFWLLSLISNI